MFVGGRAIEDSRRNIAKHKADLLKSRSYELGEAAPEADDFAIECDAFRQPNKRLRGSTAAEEVEHFQERLQETLEELARLNDTVQDLLDDSEYEADTVACEEYTDKCKRALRKAKGLLGAARSGDRYAKSAAQQHASSAFHVKVKTKRDKKKQQNTEPFCVYCGERGHWGPDCQKIASLQARIDALETMNRCFLCLRRGHNKNQCFKRGKASCPKCKGEHHISICSSHTTTANKIETMTSNFTYLQTARVSITGPTGKSKQTRAILVTGS
ncbi:uncharacterized protein LOC124556018 [Schistocerca americana]|uniref:uncharacterized protein LOC124556018 n=1 Tax=Schistocerca americana TaxID=7009 RepID=UPI001F501B26|nr:uncharacterized protein LOC124556018 [Schistocerca americana]